MNELIDSRTMKSSIDWMSKTRAKKSTRLIDWLIRRTKKSTIDWMSIDLDEQKNRLLIVIIADSRSFSQTHDYSRWLTMRIVKMKCNHRFQKKNFKLTIFFWLAYFYEWFDDFLLTRVSLRNWRFYFVYSRISTSNSLVEAKRFVECQLISQNSKREICCAKDNESSSLRLMRKFRAENEIVTKLIEEFVLKMCNRHELNDFVSFYSLIVATSVKFTSFVTMKIKYNVKRMSRKQIT